MKFSGNFKLNTRLAPPHKSDCGYRSVVDKIQILSKGNKSCVSMIPGFCCITGSPIIHNNYFVPGHLRLNNAYYYKAHWKPYLAIIVSNDFSDWTKLVKKTSRLGLNDH